MPEAKLPSPEKIELMAANTGETSRRVDWSETDHTVVRPEPTLDVLKDYDYDPDTLRGQGLDVPADAGKAFAFAVAEFKGSDEFDEWSDGFSPMMSYAWPVNPWYSTAQAAAYMEEAGLACSLVELSSDEGNAYAIALTGGGMDLSDHIAAAYVCCGQLPPTEVLSSALRNHDQPRLGDHLVVAARKIASKLRSDADSIEETVSRMEARMSQPRP